MRKVKFKNFVDGAWMEGDGYFHQWGHTFEQCGEDIGKFTFAIVEAEDGKIHEIAPHDLQFKEPYENGNISII